MSGYRLHTGDSRELIRTLPSESVQACISSPPYWMQRRYDLPFEMGSEPSPEEFTDALVAFYREVRRVLRPDGLAFVNLGTTYIGGNAKPVGNWKETDAVPNAWLFGLAARADGWYLRSEIIWEKLTAKPQSADSRWALMHETIVVLAKSQAYYYDADAVRVPYAAASIARRRYADNTGDVGTRHGQHQRTGRNADGSRNGRRDRVPSTYAPNPQGRIRPSIIRCNGPSFDDGHTASYPPALVEPMLLFSTSAAGACGECGRPFERIVEKGDVLPEFQKACGGTVASGGALAGRHRPDRSRESYERQKAEDPMRVKQRILDSMRERLTVGWERACGCQTEAVKPCVVLDPFGGTHTTGRVALRFGRDYIGLEGDPVHNANAERVLREIASQPIIRFETATVRPAATPRPVQRAMEFEEQPEPLEEEKVGT